jgi:hypothetical protein
LLDRALALDPISPRAHFRRVMRMFPVDPGAMESGMAQVLEIDPDYQPALQRYAKYRWMFDGDIALGIQTVERALALDPGNPWLTHTAVAMYLDVGDAETARRLVAATESPEVAGDLLVALYDGATDVAGTAAFDDSAYANGMQENWGVYESMRDWAFENQRFQVALDSIQGRAHLSDDSGSLALTNFRAVPTVAELLFALGRNDDARRLLTETIQWIDEYHLPNFSTVYALRVKASALLLLGENELALDALDASFRSKDYLQWWYTLERDPLWVPLYDDPRFALIVTRVRRHVEEQRATLEGLRRQGAVPFDGRWTE